MLRRIIRPKHTKPCRAGLSDDGDDGGDDDDAGAEAMASEPLPSFRDVPSSERQALFLKKLRLCSRVYDFADPCKHAAEKELKRQALLDLVEYVASGSGRFSQQAMPECFAMIRANLFRSLRASSSSSSSSSGPNASGSEGFDPEEDEPSMEPAWPHLQLVYDLLMRYVNSNEADPKAAKVFIDRSFVLSLMDLFDSEDPRERESLKTILHRIYGKFMLHRPFIRKSISDVFFGFAFETQRHNGIAELLEILGSIINGFALPLKEEHKTFLARALIPLHKPKCVAMYHQQLCYCIIQFVDKDRTLADTVVRGLIKYWPVSNSQKEILFIGELEEVLDSAQPDDFQRCMVPLFRQIGRCLKSMHFQVAERALFLWNNEHLVIMATQNRQVILPLIIDVLEENTNSHWNLTVNELTSNVRKMFLDLDPKLFHACQKEYQEGRARAHSAEETREKTWRSVELLAASLAEEDPSHMPTKPESM